MPEPKSPDARWFIVRWDQGYALCQRIDSFGRLRSVGTDGEVLMHDDNWVPEARFVSLVEDQAAACEAVMAMRPDQLMPFLERLFEECKHG